MVLGRLGFMYFPTSSSSLFLKRMYFRVALAFVWGYISCLVMITLLRNLDTRFWLSILWMWMRDPTQYLFLIWLLLKTSPFHHKLSNIVYFPWMYFIFILNLIRFTESSKLQMLFQRCWSQQSFRTYHFHKWTKFPNSSAGLYREYLLSDYPPRQLQLHRPLRVSQPSCSSAPWRRLVVVDLGIYNRSSTVKAK